MFLNQVSHTFLIVFPYRDVGGCATSQSGIKSKWKTNRIRMSKTKRGRIDMQAYSHSHWLSYGEKVARKGIVDPFL